MPHWPRLEATDSIIEILWDVALVVFAIRLALLYALLTLASSSVLLTLFSLAFHNITGPTTTTTTNNIDSKVIPTTITPNIYNNNALTAYPYALPLLTLAAAALSSRVLIRRYDIPRVLAFRLAVGVGAGVVVGVLAGVLWLVECEVLGRALMEGLFVGGGGGGGDGGRGWKTGVGVVGGFVLMPAAMMGWEIAGEKVVGLFGGRRGEKGERAGDNIGEKKVMGSCDL